MINLINTYLELQKKLDGEHGIISVTESEGMPRVHVYGLDKFLEIADGQGITVIDRGEEEIPYEASFVKDNILFFYICGKGNYKRLIKMEGVKHE